MKPYNSTLANTNNKEHCGRQWLTVSQGLKQIMSLLSSSSSSLPLSSDPLQLSGWWLPSNCCRTCDVLEGRRGADVLDHPAFFLDNAFY